MRVCVATAVTLGLTVRDTRATLLASNNGGPFALRFWGRCEVCTWHDGEFRHVGAGVENMFCLGTLVILKHQAEFGGRGWRCCVKRDFFNEEGIRLLFIGIHLLLRDAIRCSSQLGGGR